MKKLLFPLLVIVLAVAAILFGVFCFYKLCTAKEVVEVFRYGFILLFLAAGVSYKK